MKKLLPALLLLSGFLSTAQVVKQWSYTTPLKQYSQIKTIEVTPDNTVYLMDGSTSGAVIKSSDNGQTWRKVYRPATSMKDMFMLDNNVGYILQTTGITKTTNAFQTTTYTPFISSDYQRIFFVNENTGFICGGIGRIYKTVNGSQNWTGIHTGHTNEVINDVYFTDENNGIACATNGKIFKTVNQGANWTLIPTSTTMPLNKILYVGNTTFYIAGVWGTILRSIDGGDTWTQMQTDTQYNFVDIKKIDGKFIAVGRDGRILKSDTGDAWTEQIITNVQFDDLFSVAKMGNQLIIGGDGWVFNNTPAGTWVPFMKGLEYSNLVDVSFFDSNRGYVVGNGNYYTAAFRTDDGGKNWVTQGASPSTQSGTRRINLMPDGRGISVGGNSYAITSNFGTTWTGGASVPVAAVSAGWLKQNGDFFLGTNSVVGNGLIRKTAAGWNQWTDIQNVVNIKFLNEMVGYTGSEYGYMHKTTDGGNTWQPAGQINYAPVNTLNVVSENVVYANRYRTTDGGQTWNDTSFGIIWSFHFFNENFGRGLDSNGSVYETNDGGDNWQKIIDSDVNDPMYYSTAFTKAYFMQDKIVGIYPNTDIYVLDVAGALGVRDFKNNALTVTAYPNPVTDRLYLKSEAAIVKVTLYDEMGKEIPSKFDGEFISMENLAPNLYFVKVETVNGTGYKKVIKK